MCKPCGWERNFFLSVPYIVSFLFTGILAALAVSWGNVGASVAVAAAAACLAGACLAAGAAVLAVEANLAALWLATKSR